MTTVKEIADAVAEGIEAAKGEPHAVWKTAAAVAMPRYRCHKEVWALQIDSIESHPGGLVLHFTEHEVYAPLAVSEEWATKHRPGPKGYYVVYADGYASYSPQKAFEEGYTRL